MAYAEVFSDGAALVEVNAETDFVAKNDKFIEFVKDVCYVVGKWGPVDMDTLMTLPYRKTGLTVQQALQEMVLTIGENIKIRRFVRYDNGTSVAYNHMNGRIGVLLNMEVSAGLEENAAVLELGKDLAMQIAAMNPAFLDKADVSQETLDKEKEIQLAMMANDPKMAAKPDKVKEGIVMGKLGKFYEENCLMQQAFVKENKVSVEKHVAAVAKEVGGSIQIKGFYPLRAWRGPGEEGRELRRGDCQAAGPGLISFLPIRNECERTRGIHFLGSFFTALNCTKGMPLPSFRRITVDAFGKSNPCGGGGQAA